jgi:small redox-active disulfide protein 2
MKHIKILGSGCPKCRTLYVNADAAAQSLGIEYTIEKVTDMKEIMSYRVMSTPCLVVDEVVKSSGRLPGPEEIRKFLN